MRKLLISLGFSLALLCGFSALSQSANVQYTFSSFQLTPQTFSLVSMSELAPIGVNGSYIIVNGTTVTLPTGGNGSVIFTNVQMGQTYQIAFRPSNPSQKITTFTNSFPISLAGTNTVDASQWVFYTFLAQGGNNNQAASIGFVTNLVTVTSNGIIALISSSQTNGLATTNYVNLQTLAATNGMRNGAYSDTNNFASLAQLATATNGLVTGAVTNNLATVAYVNSATNSHVSSSITNGFATIQLVNTNGINSTNFALALSNSTDANWRGATNRLGSAAYSASAAFDSAGAALAATNPIAANILAATNNGNIVFTNMLTTATNSAASTAYFFVTNSGTQITNDIVTTSNALINYVSATNIISGNAWVLSGNNVSSGQFLGSTNNQAVIEKVNGTNILTLFPNGSIIGGFGSSQFNPVDLNSVVFGATNQAQNTFSTIVGGSFNLAGIYGFVGNGSGNNSTQSGATLGYTFIGNGTNNTEKANFSSILNGNGNNASGGSYLVIGSGLNNSNNGNNYSIILSGQNNWLKSQMCEFIGTGETNFVHGDYSTILNGNGNTIGNLGGNNWHDSLILGGTGNRIGDTNNATYSLIGTSKNSWIRSGDFSYILGGFSNNIQTTSGAWALGENINITNNNVVAISPSGGIVNSTTNDQLILSFTNGVILNGQPLVNVAANVTNGLATTNASVLQSGQATNIVANNTFSLGGGLTYIITTNILGVTNCGFNAVNGTYNNFGKSVWTNQSDARWTIQFVPASSYGFFSNATLFYLNPSLAFIGTNYTAQGTAATPTPIVFQGIYHNPYGQVNVPAMPITVTGTNDPNGLVIAPLGSQYVYFTNGLPKYILINTNNMSGWY